MKKSKPISLIISIVILLMIILSLTFYSFQQRNLINEQSGILLNHDYKLNQQFRKELLILESTEQNEDNYSFLQLNFWDSVYHITYLADDNNQVSELTLQGAESYIASDEDQYNLLIDILEMQSSIRQFEQEMTREDINFSNNDLGDLFKTLNKLNEDILILQEGMRLGLVSQNIKLYNEQSVKDKKAWINLIETNIEDIKREIDNILS